MPAPVRVPSAETRRLFCHRASELPLTIEHWRWLPGPSGKHRSASKGGYGNIPRGRLFHTPPSLPRRSRINGDSRGCDR